jgi:putative DNA primase/helicase
MTVDAGSKVDAAIAAAGYRAKPDGTVLLRAADLKPQPVRWLWRDWLARGKLHVMAGAPGQGKTTLALQMAATITVGGRWPDGSRSEAGSVLIWSGEDDPADTLTPRLIAMGANLDKVHFVSGTRVRGEELPFDPANDMPQLAAAAERIGDVLLLIVDPVVSAVAADSHKNTEVRRALQPLVDLGNALDLATLGISHFGKGGAGRDPTERVIGSIAFAAVARLVMVVAQATAEDGEKCRMLARSKSNIGPDDGGFEFGVVQVELDDHPGVQASRVKWGCAVEGTARELLADAEASQDGDSNRGAATSDAVEALRLILSTDSVPSKSATAQMKSEGHSEKAIRTARERLNVVVSRSGFGVEMKSYWRLPPSLMPIDAHSRPSKERASMGTNGQESPADQLGTDCEVF